MTLFIFEVLVRLLSYGKHLGVASCQLLSVRQEKCLLFPISLGAKATVSPTSGREKKNLSNYSALYFLQGQAGSRSSQTVMLAVFNLVMYLVPFSHFSTFPYVLVAPTIITTSLCRPDSLILITKILYYLTGAAYIIITRLRTVLIPLLLTVFG